MTFQEIKATALTQTNNDIEDIDEFLPHLDGYVNEGYDQLVVAYAGAHAGTDAYPRLANDEDAPKLPEWTHPALANWATWLLYRNGNPQKQQRGLYFKAAFEDALSRVYLEGGEKGKRTRFINVYP